MIAESLKVMHIITVSYVLFVTLSLRMIQGKLAIDQALSLTVFWLLVITPMFEYIGLAWNYIPYFLVAFSHSSILLVGPVILLYIQPQKGHRFDVYRFSIALFPFAIFFTARLLERNDIPNLIILLYISSLTYYQYIFFKKLKSKNKEKEEKKPKYDLISKEKIIVFYFILSIAYAAQVITDKLGSPYLRFILDITNILNFSYVLLLSKNYIILIKGSFSPPSKDSKFTHELIKSKKETLDNLLKVEKIHLRSELSLSCLAKELELSPNQTSELLNKHLKTSFYSLINKYRVKSAMSRIMSSDEELSITELYMSSGFSNKNTFYKEFKKEFDISPRKFIKSRLIDKP
ncbi:helix-turn-helix domain-containing protein [Pseudoalteromonas luteoviolacea]|uniref:helix-turn-helix domain-containing protein n=1 Tax=Pseudoalteromonas luteoviolacea TaxID=43657 RepID=UPI001B39C97D|nr:helix-turn-helix domain-containing protein [Pseudoalteromonas luteoviolacea]MBQ4810400.1 helix-turn-helix domain-containing protein [Pseudoalteromonas luteoviolacea]